MKKRYFTEIEFRSSHIFYDYNISFDEYNRLYDALKDKENITIYSCECNLIGALTPFTVYSLNKNDLENLTYEAQDPIKHKTYQYIESIIEHLDEEQLQQFLIGKRFSRFNVNENLKNKTIDNKLQEAKNRSITNDNKANDIQQPKHDNVER